MALRLSSKARKDFQQPRGHRGVVVGLLVVAVFACFWPVLGNGFIEVYDDGTYVTQNLHVQGGVTAEAIRWALTATTGSNWHPLTWISHMVDCALFGLRPLGHHATSLVLHAANACLLFTLLLRLTASLGRSAAAAFLFALHPLRVESVAWVAERKDVLSGLLFLLTLWAYVAYVASPRPGRYAVLLLTFAAGLAAKPMLVTTPFVLLLLDVWPLERTGAGLRRLLLEKAPLLALTAASAAVTIWAQSAGHALRSFRQFPSGVRVENAVVSYVLYLGKVLWPSGLAVLYPHPGSSLAGWQVGGAVIVLATITWGALRLGRRRPYLPVGWLWYVGMLVPVIGIVQVGEQGLADRYSYLPSIGLSLMLAWSIPATGVAWAAVGAAAIALGACTWRQATYWRDSETLFRRTIGVTRDNAVAHLDLGLALYRRGRMQESIEHFRESLRIRPEFEAAHSNLGVALGDVGRYDEAIAEDERARDIDPSDPDVYNNLGSVYYREGRRDEAIEQFRRALRLNSEHANACYNLGTALAAGGDWNGAAVALRSAIRLDPDNPSAHANLAAVLLGLGDDAGAWREVRASRALGLEPPKAVIAKLAARMPEPR
jgi:Flp pilus assembly protein TadD